MKLTKKLLAVLVALVMTMSLTVAAFAAPGDDEAETTKKTTSATSDEAVARATADNEEEDGEEEEDERRAVDEIISSYNNHNGRVMSVAKAGYPRLYPEDSLSGLAFCVENGVDIISVTVQQTKDKGLVLLEDAHGVKAVQLEVHAHVVAEIAEAHVELHLHPSLINRISFC